MYLAAHHGILIPAMDFDTRPRNITPRGGLGRPSGRRWCGTSYAGRFCQKATAFARSAAAEDDRRLERRKRIAHGSHAGGNARLVVTGRHSGITLDERGAEGPVYGAASSGTSCTRDFIRDDARGPRLLPDSLERFYVVARRTSKGEAKLTFRSSPIAILPRSSFYWVGDIHAALPVAPRRGNTTAGPLFFRRRGERGKRECRLFHGGWSKIAYGPDAGEDGPPAARGEASWVARRARFRHQRPQGWSERRGHRVSR